MGSTEGFVGLAAVGGLDLAGCVLAGALGAGFVLAGREFHGRSSARHDGASQDSLLDGAGPGPGPGGPDGLKGGPSGVAPIASIRRRFSSPGVLLGRGRLAPIGMADDRETPAVIPKLDLVEVAHSLFRSHCAMYFWSARMGVSLVVCLKFLITYLRLSVVNFPNASFARRESSSHFLMKSAVSCIKTPPLSPGEAIAMDGGAFGGAGHFIGDDERRPDRRPGVAALGNGLSEADNPDGVRGGGNGARGGGGARIGSGILGIATSSIGGGSGAPASRRCAERRSVSISSCSISHTPPPL
mmetsp:Transcript_2132/g.4898  ORF Transcript_2132/g.4898 Transcript_2132/m.4898 type:complete len:299 (-) Transcript_2132:137-1033(-)